MADLIRGIRRGDPITASFLNAIVQKLLRVFIAGPGLAIRRTGAGQVLIELTGFTPRRGGRSSEVTAETRAALEALPLQEGGWYRTTGAIKRAYRYIDGLLICYTHFESS